MCRYIFFDLDGTLTDSKPGIVNCVRYALEKLNAPVPEESVLLKFIGPPLQDSFAEHCGFDEEKTSLAVEYFRERYAVKGQYENLATPGVVDCMARLKEKGYRMALSSSKVEEMCISISQHFGFAPYLDAIVGSPAGGDCTKADIIRQTMQRLGLSEEDKASVLMVGDRKYDALGAGECGIRCLGVEFFGYALPGELEEAGAVAVVQTVEDMERYILTH